MSKYYLIHESVEPLRLDRWYLLERGIDFLKLPTKLKESKDGSIKTTTNVIYESNSLPDMLHQIHSNKDWRFYVVSDSLNSLGHRSREKYPHHRHICSLAGFIPEVCDIRLREGKPFFDAKWEIDFQTELWVSHGGWGGDQLLKVEGFTEKMDRAVRDFLTEHNLDMGIKEADNEKNN